MASASPQPSRSTGTLLVLSFKIMNLGYFFFFSVSWQIRAAGLQNSSCQHPLCKAMGSRSHRVKNLLLMERCRYFGSLLISALQNFNVCHYPRTRVILQKGKSQVQVFRCIWLWMEGSGLVNAEGARTWSPCAD